MNLLAVTEKQFRIKTYRCIYCDKTFTCKNRITGCAIAMYACAFKNWNQG